MTTFFFFLIQETVLSIIIAFRFSLEVSGSTIVLTVVYLVGILFYFAFIFKIKIPFFTNRFIQYHTIVSKKIVYSLFVILNFEDQYLLFVFMLANFALEIVFDIKNNEYPLKSTMVVYKILEALCILFGLIYFLVEMNANKQSSTDVVAYFLAFFLVSLMLCFFVEISLKVYSLICNSLKENKNSISNDNPDRSNKTKSGGKRTRTNTHTKNLT